VRRVQYDPEAEAELLDDIAYFERERRGHGDRFLSAIQAAIERIHRFPYLGRRSAGRTRRLTLVDFRYDIVYRVTDDLIFIFAIAHHSRRRNYWRHRLP
jgi:toxin ParE1/3/4